MHFYKQTNKFAMEALVVVPRVIRLANLCAAFSSGDGERHLCARSCVSFDIRYCRAAAARRRSNRSFLALLESRRLKSSACAPLVGSVFEAFRKASASLKSDTSFTYDRLNVIRSGRWRDL